MKIQYWTQTEAAKHCGCSESYIRAAVKAGKLTIAGYVGRGRMIAIREVVKWTNKRKRKRASHGKAK
jgi:predicted DNA-binding protein (UPF0251 family)